MINFHEISITGLFGRVNVTLPIKNNRVIIVGNNGIGKSTILNAFYYFVSYQWEKLREIHFDSIKVHAESRFGYKEFVVEQRSLADVGFHRQMLLFESHNPTLYGRNLPRIASILTRHDLRVLSSTKISRSEIRSIANKNQLPISMIDELHREISDIDKTLPSHLKEIEHFLDENLEGRVLYLPTYRRIEKDIKSIFPEIENEIQRATKFRRIRGHRNQQDPYVELVNFGMEDVNLMIKYKMESLRDFALSEIRALSTRYLSDVIRSRVNEPDASRVRNIDKDNLKRIFVNIDEALLDDEDKSKIYEVDDKIKAGKEIEENEKYVAHYISSLIDISEKMAEKEKSVQEFVSICESYLFDKKIKFDNADYSLQIVYDDKNSTEVSMENLSSGEKQIISTFAHMTLDDSPKNYVIIDEPELSLSVGWQEKFLQDISDLESCAFIGAVTHSPFVFDNSLDQHAIDMLSYISR